jgi:hypothetical protein
MKSPTSYDVFRQDRENSEEDDLLITSGLYGNQQGASFQIRTKQKSNRKIKMESLHILTLSDVTHYRSLGMTGLPLTGDKPSEVALRLCQGGTLPNQKKNLRG